METSKNKDNYIDDGRVIAKMNVDGMPWYVPKAGLPVPLAEPANGKAAGDGAQVQPGLRSGAPEMTNASEMTRAEKAAFTWGVLKASMLAVLVFAGTLFAFIMFCIYVWFR